MAPPAPKPQRPPISHPAKSDAPSDLIICPPSISILTHKRPRLSNDQKQGKRKRDQLSSTMLHILDLPTELLLHITAFLLPAPAPPSSSLLAAASASSSSSADGSPSTPSYNHFRAYLALRHTCRTLHTLLPLPTYKGLLPHASVLQDAGWLPCDTCLRMRPSNYFFGGLRHDGIGTLDPGKATLAPQHPRPAFPPSSLSGTPYLQLPSHPPGHSDLQCSVWNVEEHGLSASAGHYYITNTRFALPPPTCIDCSPYMRRTRFFFTPLAIQASNLESSSSSSSARHPSGAVASTNGTLSTQCPSSSGRMYCICNCCGWLGRSSLNMQVCAACFDEDFGGDVPPSACHRQQLPKSKSKSGVGNNTRVRARDGDLIGDILRAEEEKRMAVPSRGAGAEGGQGGGPEGDAGWEKMQLGLGTFLGGSGG